MERDDVLRDLKKQYYDKDENLRPHVTHEDFYKAVGKRFGWTLDEAYIATEFLFRPPNYN